MGGRNMEAESSSADLLGDGQPTDQAPPSPPPVPAPTPTLRPLPPPPPPPPKPALEVLEASPLSREAHRALSLAYELSLAVRQQASSNVRASMSVPEGTMMTALASHREDKMLVPRGKQVSVLVIDQ